jgi:hypothetical protein
MAESAERYDGPPTGAKFQRRSRGPVEAIGPPPRERERGPAPMAGDKYERYEGTPAEVTLADTEAVIITFSGKPDAISLSSRSFGAVVRFTDRLGRDADNIVILPNTTVHTHQSAEQVRARNLTAGSNALLSVIGKWASLGE